MLSDVAQVEWGMMIWQLRQVAGIVRERMETDK